MEQLLASGGMEQFFAWAWDIVLHLDKHLESVVRDYHAWAYLLLFAIIFCETGLVVTPFLPGDSLLFAAGSVAALNSGIEVGWLLVILSAAAILGDSNNYWIGRFIGPKIFHKDKVRFLNKENLVKAHEFYERHGGKTVAIARFLPILRTFAPFVAGIGRMNYARFVSFSVGGTICWISLFVLAGYRFGSIPAIKNNFATVIMAIVVISLIPAAVTFVRQKFGRKNSPRLAGVACGSADADRGDE